MTHFRAGLTAAGVAAIDLSAGNRAAPLPARPFVSAIAILAGAGIAAAAAALARAGGLGFFGLGHRRFYFACWRIGL
jgi:hypothetical protein